MPSSSPSKSPAKPWLAAALSVVFWGLGLYYAGVSFLIACTITVAATIADIGIRYVAAMVLPWNAVVVFEVLLSVAIAVGFALAAVALTRRKMGSSSTRKPVQYVLTFTALLLLSFGTSLAKQRFDLDPVIIVTAGVGSADPAVLAGDRLFVNAAKRRDGLPPAGTLAAFRDPQRADGVHVRRVHAGQNPDSSYLVGLVEGVVWSRDPDAGMRWDRLLLNTP